MIEQLLKLTCRKCHQGETIPPGKYFSLLNDFYDAKGTLLSRATWRAVNLLRDPPASIGTGHEHLACPA